MSYKTILVQVDNSRHAEPRIEAAARIARAENAHLIGLALTGVAETLLYAPMAMSPADPGLAPYLDSLRQQAAAALDKFDGIASRIGVTSYEKQLVENETATGISLRARCCDLVVLGQPDPNETSSIGFTSDLPEYVVMNSGGPVLMIPYVGSGAIVGEHALVAWNAGVEAARSMHFAIPLLKHAKVVEVAIFNPDSQPEDVYGVPPGVHIQSYLARHGIDAKVIAKATEGEIGEALLTLADSTGCDLLVMGCYGHARFREILLGGATRTVLRSTIVPVLLAH